MSRKILFRRNGTAGVLPEADQLTVGEITLNYAADEEQLATLNSEGEVATFSSDTIHNAYHRNAELVIASALNDLEERKADKEDTYTKDEVDNLLENVEIDIDDEMSPTSENPVQNKVIYQTIVDNEEVTAAALNDLEDRKADKEDTYTKDEIDILLENAEITIDDAMSSTSENPVQNKVIYQTIADSERVIVAGINDLEDRKADKEDTYTKDEVDALIEGIEVDDEMSPTSENPVQNKVLYQVIDEMDFVLSAAVNDLNTNKANKSDAVMKTDIDDEMSRTSENPVQNRVVYKAIADTEYVVATSLNDLDERKADKSDVVMKTDIDDELSSTSENPVQNKILKAELDRIDLVTAAALNALNSKIDNKTFDVDDELDDESENPVQNMVISKELSDITKATAAAMNDLNERKADKTGVYSKDEIDDMMSHVAVDIEIDDQMDENSENPVQNKVILDYITEIEHVAASAINDLNTRKADNARFVDIEDALDEKANVSDLATVATTGDYNDLINTPDTEQLESVTWSALKAKRDGGTLVPGKWYRITDYQCTTTQENTSAANHLFDVVVLALSNNTLSEEARALQHAGDSYFANSKVNAWKIWYCLDNDTTRFTWAENGGYSVTADTGGGQVSAVLKRVPSRDEAGYYCWSSNLGSFFTTTDVISANDTVSLYGTPGEPGTLIMTVTIVTSTQIPSGKGVIYHMIDEYSNECFYDFKNIQFKVPLTNGSYDSSGTDTFVYTFNLWDDGTCKDAVLNPGNNQNNYIDLQVSGNIIEYCTDDFADNKRSTVLNFTVFLLLGSNNNRYCFDNIIGINNYNCIFDSHCSGNRIGNRARNNCFGLGFENNIIGMFFQDNVCDYNFKSNIIADWCTDNIFGYDFGHCRLGYSTARNVFGNNISCLNSGDYFSNCQIGANCGNITAGNLVQYIIIPSYSNNITFGNDVQYVSLSATSTPTAISRLRNIEIKSGIQGTSNTQKVITHPTLGDTFLTTYQPANSQVISV